MIYKPLNSLGVLALMLCVSPAFGDDSKKVGKSLGGHPVCEASAALIVKCPEESDRHCLLVGDNEKEKNLYLFGIDGAQLTNGFIQKISLKRLPHSGGGKFEIGDIEALSRLPSGEVLVYGSHSRNKRCKKKGGERRFFAKASLSKDGLDPNSAFTFKAKPHSCESLFGKNPNPDMQKVCAEVNRTELLAEKAKKAETRKLQEKKCNADPAFNLEGAVAVPDADGGARLWIGLRAPLVDGKAVLLRQVKDLDEFKFDGVAFVELGGRSDFPNYGIRELTLSGDRIWGIGGPPSDPSKDQKKPHHTLWNFAADRLKNGAVIKKVTEKGTLPTSSEGLAIHEGRAFVLIDGDEQKNADECKVNSTYIVIDDLGN